MNGFQHPNDPLTEEQIISLLDDSSSFSDYRSTMTSLSDHPLADTDPSISPPSSPPPPKTPNSNDHDSPNTNPSKESETASQLKLKITVSNPKKEVESSTSIVPGGNTYVTYLITTKTNIPEFGGPQFTVRRRFKDVVVLSERLAESYRGFVIPPRPDKSVVESQVMQKQAFVEQRMMALEKYLQRLGEHPVVSQSDELRVFLQAHGTLPFVATESVKSRWDFVRVVGNGFGGDEDVEFVESKERLVNLEKRLSDCYKWAEVFVKAQHGVAETMGAFGLSFIKLTKFENQHAVVDACFKRANDMKNVATAAIKSSRYYRELNSRTDKHLDTLHDHMGLLQGVHTALGDRLSALLTVQTLTSELNSLYLRAEKLRAFGNDTAKSLKLGEVKEAIRVTEDAKSCATNEYERIKGNNRTEIERLDRQRKGDLKDMLKGFVLNQLAFSEKIGMEWSKVAEETRGYAC